MSQKRCVSRWTKKFLEQFEVGSQKITFRKSDDLLFSVEKIFRKENFQFSSRGFFPFPETAHDAQIYPRAYWRAEQLVPRKVYICGCHRG